jgi:hypothetical protein
MRLQGVRWLVMPKSREISGQRFGRLTAIRMTAKGSKTHRQRWLFRCGRGNKIEVDKASVTKGKTSSCGCLRAETTAKRLITHGHTVGRTPSLTYQSWCNMRERCGNPNNKRYKDYGGRGIAVCERWSIFENFLADMDSRPSPEHSLDRIDPNGNYEPGNCRWATPFEQQNNTRRNASLTIDGRKQTLAQWEHEAGIPAGRLHH